MNCREEKTVSEARQLLSKEHSGVFYFLAKTMDEDRI
jgi:hypothetical protein